MLLTKLKQQPVCMYLYRTDKPHPTPQLQREEAGSPLAALHSVTESLLIPALYALWPPA